MEEANIIRINLAKRSSPVHGARADAPVAYRKKLSQGAALDACRPRQPTVARQTGEATVLHLQSGTKSRQPISARTSSSTSAGIRNSRPPAEDRPVFLVEITVQREPATRALIDVDHPLREKELADLVPSHLLRRRPFASEELAPRKNKVCHAVPAP